MPVETFAGSDRRRSDGSFLVRASVRDHKFSGMALGLAMVGVAGALAVLWATARRADVSFLPGMAPAEWIVYPVTPDGNSQPVLELPTVFAHSFVLGRVPSKAALHIAGFLRYTLAINGQVVDQPARTGTDWKQPDLLEVAGHLQSGTNRIEVTVLNASGPPALWLSLDAGGRQVNSGANWQASLAGATWRGALPAAAPRLPATDGPNYRLPRAWPALGSRWPTLLFFALLSAAGCWLLRPGTAVPPPDPGAARVGSKPAWRRWRREVLLLAVLAGCWVVLFANNLGVLPGLTGFDAQAHLDYIRYLQEHHSLPLASQGFEMFQPPLYYLLAAAWLELLRLAVSDPGGIVALRLLGLAIGLAHLAIVRASLRLLFPAERSTAAWGIVLAASLPPMLYLSQYVTNEALAAMLASACIWLTLRAMQPERLSWIRCACLGLGLGAALLAKSSALLVLPPVVGALLWKMLEQRTLSPAQGLSRLGAILALAAGVGGWHYARLWFHYGSPLAGNWDPQLGFSWWQYDGYRTAGFYLRWGGALMHPWSALPLSFGDGVYATLWGDGLLSSAVDFFSRPPWNYDLMAVGYWLALVPTLAVMAGGILAVVRFIGRPSAEWFLVLGFGGLVLGAMVYMSLVVPFSMAKAFYGLSALIPFCVVGAVGLDFLTRRSRWLGSLVGIMFGLWAVNTYASFWISRSSIPTAVAQARTLARNGQDRAATDFLTDFLRQQLRREPQNADLRFSLAYFLTISGRVDEGVREAETLLKEDPGDGRGHHVLALAFAQRQQSGKAIEELRQVMTLAPGYNPGWEGFAPLLIASGRPEETVSVCRQALAMAPSSPGLRLALGSTLLLLNQTAEASAQLRYAYRLDPRSVDQLAGLAWQRATATNPAERNGAVAVKLAEQACALAGDRKPIDLEVLAASYAEAGRFAEAVRTAERAEESARAAGDADGTAHARQLLERFRAGLPWRSR